MTMTLVSTVTVGAGGAASIEFTSIPQTGTDLLLIVSSRSSGTNGLSWVTFNGSTSGYSNRHLIGSGSAATSTTSGSAEVWLGNTVLSSYTANTFGNQSIYIPNYAGSTYKSVSVDGVNENNATAAEQRLVASLWSNTAAITSISYSTGSGGPAQYSTASLYIITKGSGGATVS